MMNDDLKKWLGGVQKLDRIFIDGEWRDWYPGIEEDILARNGSKEIKPFHLGEKWIEEWGR